MATPPPPMVTLPPPMVTMPPPTISLPTAMCTPNIETSCAAVELARKAIKDVEQCYTVTRTVCTESTLEIDNEVCSYSYQPKAEITTAKTVEVSFVKECETMMVTVCEPGHGYGYGGYGHNYC